MDHFMECAAEGELIDRARLGDRGALGELFGRHYHRSVRVARRILPHGAEWQDAVQAAYLDVMQHIDKFRGEAAFSTWVTRLVVNRCLMILRAPAHRNASLHPLSEDGPVLEFVSPEPSPEKTAWCREVAAAHSDAMSRLPQSLRDAYVLYFVSELPIGEVAGRLGLTVVATKSRLFRARHRMRKVLAGVRSGGRKGTRVRVQPRELRQAA